MVDGALTIVLHRGRMNADHCGACLYIKITTAKEQVELLWEKKIILSNQENLTVAFTRLILTVFYSTRVSMKTKGSEQVQQPFYVILCFLI